ncbi:MAG TPA: lysophospholipid acyltransferase family protein [Burkholderiaceae bacterium]
MIAKLYRLGLMLIAPITIVAAFAHVALGVLYAALLFPWIGARWRDAAVIGWSRLLLLLIGVRLDSRGLLPEPGDGASLPSAASGRGAGGEGGSLGSLLLINHTSWLDVFSIAAVVPARFVSKAEIGRWPLAGWLAIAVGTLFVERGKRHAVMRTNQAVSDRLRSGQLIGVFPEGTTTDGSRLLPFHANLVQPAIDLEAPIRPVGLRFTQRGEFSRVAMFVGEMNLMQSLWRVVTAPHLAVELHWLPPIDPQPATRHAAARAARAAIAHELAVPLDEHQIPSSEPSAAPEDDDTEPGPRSAPAG